MNVTALAGGVGGAKLLVGLDRSAGTGSHLTAIVNTGDDATIYGVHVSPDVDIVTYWLAGIADTERGWGLKDDRFTIVDQLAELGHDSWFRLGDRDLATCVYRTERMREGATLTEVTSEIAENLGVRARILPMTNDRVATLIDVKDGRTLEFQEYFVKERQEPEVTGIRFDGIDVASPAPGVIDAISSADKVFLCPSNPLVSIGPILSLPGVREALRAHPDVVAVSPIVEGAALKGPADRMLASEGVSVSASGVAGMYRDFLTSFVIDERDPAEAAAVAGLGVEPLMRDTVMVDAEHSEDLARSLL
jgi:LPPG:FO 2-phospho-L-lactate transferase